MNNKLIAVKKYDVLTGVESICIINLKHLLKVEENKDLNTIVFYLDDGTFFSSNTSMLDFLQIIKEGN